MRASGLAGTHMGKHEHLSWRKRNPSSKTGHANAACLRSRRAGEERNGGREEKRKWLKWALMKISLFPSASARLCDRPCVASRPCQGNKDAWCDLTSNAGLNLREWNKRSGPTADVSKLFYKDKSAQGHSWVRIFIKVTHGDAGVPHIPHNNNKRSLLPVPSCP